MPKQESVRTKVRKELEKLLDSFGEIELGYKAVSTDFKEVIESTLNKILSLTTEPDNRPSVVFKKINSVYVECFIDGEDVFKGWTTKPELDTKMITCPECEHTWAIGISKPSVPSVKEIKKEIFYKCDNGEPCDFCKFKIAEAIHNLLTKGSQ